MTIPGEHRKITVVDATHLAAPITELEQARAHLRQAQNRLAGHRAAGFNQFWVPATADPDCFAREKADVLAALSWVWDAQERVFHQIKTGCEDMARALRERGVEPTTLYVPDSPELREAIRTGWQGLMDLQLVNVSAVPRRADRFYRSPPRPNRRAAAPASRGRRRRS